ASAACGDDHSLEPPAVAGPVPIEERLLGLGLLEHELLAGSVAEEAALLLIHVDRSRVSAGGANVSRFHDTRLHLRKKPGALKATGPAATGFPFAPGGYLFPIPFPLGSCGRASCRVRMIELYRSVSALCASAASFEMQRQCL